MPKITYTLPTGEERTVEAAEGATVMHTALSALIPGIIGECGGELSCATCHVYVDPLYADMFPPKDAAEEDMLQVTAAEPDEYSRLSCQLRCTTATSGVVVRVPDVQ
jgi:2Fe-2S ferredoxin